MFFPDVVRHHPHKDVHYSGFTLCVFVIHSMMHKSSGLSIRISGTDCKSHGENYSYSLKVKVIEVKCIVKHVNSEYAEEKRAKMTIRLIRKLPLPRYIHFILPLLLCLKM